MDLENTTPGCGCGKGGLEAAIAEKIKEKKPLMLGMLAKEFGVTELEAARALPAEMRRFAARENFDAVWEALTGWEAATFIMQHLGTVLEVKGAIPPGSYGHGYFNLKSSAGIGGHVKVDDLEAMAFMSMPFMGLESLSVQFFNAAGEVKFSVYAGRNEQREIIPAIRESFDAMRESLCKEGA